MLTSKLRKHPDRVRVLRQAAQNVFSSPKAVSSTICSGIDRMVKSSEMPGLSCLVSSGPEAANIV